MPRGQYDRTKTKAQRAAEKTSSEGTPSKVKKARAPWGSKSGKLAKTAKSAAVASTKSSSSFSIQELANMRAAFIGNVPNKDIVAKLDTLILRELDAEIGADVPQVFTNGKAQAATPIQQLSAPVTFNPTVPTQS